ncbi:uncharacterized protein [Henckelia pumila]|uniref:uncharacterized protein n=1 Tax=Henckelia pumila TaxID=405737 RepID=UPI003C6E7FF4
MRQHKPSIDPHKILRKKKKMATSNELIEAERKLGAEIFHGEAVCKEKMGQILEEYSLPASILPLKELMELGFNRSNGFFWLKQKQKTEHKFKKIGDTILYDVEVTAFVEQRRMTKLTGVKTKARLIPMTICEMIVGSPSHDKVKIVTSSGLYRVHPISALMED